ncbi:MAG: hypothetical protein Fur0037_08710 [Planctomycetota bacterium]
MTQKALLELEAIRDRFGGGEAARKLALLVHLDRAPMPSASMVRRLHEVLCYLRAYPDDAAVLSQVEQMLRSFAGRRDLKRFRRALVDSGIAGTSIRYPFFAATARWLSRRFPGSLRVVWSDVNRKQQELLDGRLPLLASYPETPALDEVVWPMSRWVARLAGPSATDADFLIERSARIGRTEAECEAFYEEMALPLELRPGPGTPSRSQARLEGEPVRFQSEPLDRSRPDLRRVLRRKPFPVRDLDEREGARVVDLAREAMVLRHRDLDAFAHGDPRDVRLFDCGRGLQFAVIGVKPERRLMLESVYAFLTLQNGVPIGYVLVSGLFASSEIAYNVFDTWRGGEAARIYGQVLAAAKQLFGADTFTIYPYQLGGDGNDEGLKSGAWWFYQKLGFRARDPDVLALMERELAAMARKRGYRSSIATLRKLAAHNVYWSSGRPRDDVIGIFPLSAIGLAATDYLASRFGADRERGLQRCSREAARLLGCAGWRRWDAGERLWFERWSPLVLALPGVEGWPARDRALLADVIRKKGGRRESDYARALDSHRRLRRALHALAARER